jgi:hypothetical protein
VHADKHAVRKSSGLVILTSVVGGSMVYRTKRRFAKGNREMALSEEARLGAARKRSGAETNTSALARRAKRCRADPSRANSVRSRRGFEVCEARLDHRNGRTGSRRLAIGCAQILKESVYITQHSGLHAANPSSAQAILLRVSGC